MRRVISCLLLALLLCQPAGEAASMPVLPSAAGSAPAPLSGFLLAGAAPVGFQARPAPHTPDKADEPSLPPAAPPSPSAAADEASPGGSDAAAAIISGSRRPGILDHQLIRSNRPDKPEINISYPSVGSREIDADIRQWATGIADVFEETLSATAYAPGAHQSQVSPYELWGSYSLTRPSPAALSITFEIWTYTGGAHGNLDIITLNYSLLTGQRLGLVDIFEDSEAALALMSAWSHKQLAPRLGGVRQEQTLRDGLMPVPENFASLTLTPEGVRINFQPYQVAPWAAGAQSVDMPLEELLPAKPLLRLWDK